MVSLLLLLCAAAPEWVAWLEESAAIAPEVEQGPATDGTSASGPRARPFAVVGTGLPTVARLPVVHAPLAAPGALDETPRTRRVVGRSPATPRGPPAV